MKKKEMDLICETPEKAAPEGETTTVADVDAIMRKYDRESNTRIWTGIPKMI